MKKSFYRSEMLENLSNMFLPFFALDNATQTRFFVDKNPIFPSLFDLTSESKMISDSSPWKLSTTVVRTFAKSVSFLYNGEEPMVLVTFSIWPV